ncbi:bZIP transcription factor [Fibrella sp. HMF5036]|uniref:BZIP transcription factor n=2 Tax=Fibrella aquatilis TaxID=2817059 RepID=A0A939G250_9BACT|nr:bZIP transcription factor [Fibrella aquatilis]
MSGASNLFIGRGTGIQNMAGTQNVFLGASAGSLNTSGQGNSFVGYSSGFSNVGGNNNTFMGSGAGYSNDAGFSNLFIGQRSGYFNTGGSNNAFLGTGAGYSNGSGSNNAFLGSDAGSSNTSGGDNVFAGSLAGSGNSTGQQNVFVGSKAGSVNTGSQNTFVGFESGASNINGLENTFIGYHSGFNNVSGVNNTFIGYSAGLTNTGINNTFIGQRAGANNTTGINNLFLGATAGANNVSGSGNFMMGNAAGNANSTGSGNIYIGDGAGLKGNTSNNIAIGQYAGNNFIGNSTGNVAVGQVAGAFGNNTSNSVFLGKDSGIPQSFSTVQLDNVVTLGAGAQVTQANSVILGNNANVGIGTTAPGNKLEIVSAAAGTSGLRLKNLTTANPGTIATATRFLTVNANGDVVLGSTTGARLGADGVDGNWSVEGANLTNTNAGGVVIGPGVSKTPAGYRLYVSEGILTEKVKVAVANTSDWSDKVFDKQYNLRSLAQVEQHINAHGHLPGVPSAEEVVRDGVDVGKMDAKLLEKIEELTLYMIELKKETQALRLENKRIKQQLRRGASSGTRK